MLLEVTELYRFYHIGDEETAALRGVSLDVAADELAFAGGVVFGLMSGLISAWMLVKLLTRVFDPPPEAISIPWA